MRTLPQLSFLTALAALSTACTSGIEANGIGFMETTATGPDGISLPMAMWFPADVTEATVTASYGADIGVEGSSFDDAVPATGPFPILVLSHGNQGTRHASALLSEEWAANGYVVVSVDHVGNTLNDPFSAEAFIDTYIRRPADVGAVYAEAVALSETDGGEFEGLIDPEAFIVAGHSTGGATAQLVAGGGLNRTTIAIGCAANQITGVACDIANETEGDKIFLRPEGTPDVMASILLAPLNGSAEFQFFAADQSEVTGATLALVGSLDDTTPLQTNTQPLYDGSPAPKGLGVLDQGTHLAFATICTVPGLPSDVASECNDESLMSEETVIDLTMRTSLPWLDAYVRGNTAAAAEIEAGVASEPITWTAALQ